MKIRFEGPPETADQSRGLRVGYAAARRNIPAWRWNLIVLLLVSPLLYIAGSALLETFRVSAPGIVELKEVTLHAGQSGRIESMLPAGSRVDAGSRLLVIQPPVRDRLPVPPRPGTLRQVDSGIEQLLAYRRDRVRAYRQLFRQGAATQAELASALGQLADAEAAWRRLQAESPGPGQAVRPEGAEMEVSAPFAGVLLQAFVSPGEWVAAGSDLLTLVDEREARVVAYVDPRLQHRAETGHRVQVRFRDGTAIRGRVALVRVETVRMPAGALEKGDSALQVELQLDEALPAPYRKQRLPVEVRFDWGW